MDIDPHHDDEVPVVVAAVRRRRASIDIDNESEEEETAEEDRPSPRRRRRPNEDSDAAAAAAAADDDDDDDDDDFEDSESDYEYEDEDYIIWVDVAHPHRNHHEAPNAVVVPQPLGVVVDVEHEYVYDDNNNNNNRAEEDHLPFFWHPEAQFRELADQLQGEMRIMFADADAEPERPLALGFQDAVSFLRRQRANNADEDDDQIVVRDRQEGDAESFRQLVALLQVQGQPQQQHEEPRDDDDSGGGGGGANANANGPWALRSITFAMDWDGLPDNAMETLFRDVLPHHRTLRRISIDVGRSSLPARLLKLLTESIPAAPHPHGPRELIIVAGRWPVDGEPVDQDQVVHAVVNMLRRNTVLESITIDARLDSDHCRPICQAVPHSTRLVLLRLHVHQVLADTLEGLAASKSLQELHVTGSSFSRDAVPCFARQLRTNDTLQNLHLIASNNHNNAIPGTDELLELMQTHNYTLNVLHCNPGPYLNHRHRNDEMQSVIHELRTSGRRPNMEQLPAALGVGIDVLTYVYLVLHEYKDQIGADTSVTGRRHYRS